LGTTVDFPDAYVKVLKITGDKQLLEVAVGYYGEKNGVLIKQDVYSFSPDLDAGNFIKQAYGYLKTLLDFEGWADC
jgi:hypothetical protein